MRSLRERLSAGEAVELLLFRAGTELFGVELEAVEQIVERPELRRIPDLPGALLGMFHWRGTLVATFKPDDLLGVVSRQSNVSLVFQRAGRSFALAIDDVDDVLTVQDGEMDETPGLDFGDAMLAGVVRRGPDLIGVLDVNALFASLRIDARPGSV